MEGPRFALCLYDVVGHVCECFYHLVFSQTNLVFYMQQDPRMCSTTWTSVLPMNNSMDVTMQYVRNFILVGLGIPECDVVDISIKYRNWDGGRGTTSYVIRVSNVTAFEVLEAHKGRLSLTNGNTHIRASWTSL